MPHHRHSLRKRRLQADVSSDDCDDDGDSLPSRLQSDFATDDTMQHRMQRKTRASVHNQQPKSERQQVALFRRLEAAEVGQDTASPASSSSAVRATHGQSASSVKRRGSGKNINRRDRHGETFLHKLVTYGTVGEIERLIRQGADVNARDNADWTALHEASLKGLPDAVECLLKAGADVNVAADGGTTPLHDGAISGSLKVVELLLERGADAYRTDKSCKTPLEVSSSDEVRNCLLDHMRRTTELSDAKNRESSESASSGHRRVSFIEIYSDGEHSVPPSPSHCSSAMGHCTLDHPDGSSAYRSAAGDGLYTPLSPYMDSPGFFPDVEGHEEECHAEPDHPSPTLTPVDVFKKQRTTRASPVTRSVTVSASSSVMTLSSTSVAASPSTSATALSVNVAETRGRVTRSRSHFLMDGTDGAFQAGDGEADDGGRDGGGGYGGSGVNGDGCLVSGGGRVARSEERRESSSPPPRRNDSCVDQGPSSSPVAMYEDISDDDDDGEEEETSLTSCSAENSYTRPQELGPRSLGCFAADSDERNENSGNSADLPSSQTAGGLLIGDVSKGNQSTAFGFHSYSQTDLSGQLPAGWFKELKWKTSSCAASGGSRAVVERFSSGGRDEAKINVINGKGFTGGRISCGSGGKAQLFIVRKDVSKDSGKSPKDVLQSGSVSGPRTQEDCGITPDPENGTVRKQVVIIPSKNVQSGDVDLSSYRVDARGQSGVRCDVCIPNPVSNAAGEDNVEMDSSNLAPVEANDGSANGFCFSSTSGSGVQEVSVDQPSDRSSDTSKPQGGKSMDGQSVALKKLGRDVVVFLRKAAFDVRSEMKQFCIASTATGATRGDDSEQSNKISIGGNGAAAAAAAMVSDQCENPSDRCLFSSDLGDQSEGPKKERIKKRIVLCNSLVRKGFVPFPGAILRSSGQKECVLDWTRSKSTLLVDKSTMTAESDWEPNESAAKDQSSGGDVFRNFMRRGAAAETQTHNIGGDGNPIVAVRNVTPDACAFKLGSGDWKTSAHRRFSSSDQPSGLKKNFDGSGGGGGGGGSGGIGGGSDGGSGCGGIQSVGTVRFSSYLQKHKSATSVSDGVVKLSRTEVHDKITSLPLLASYKTTRLSSKHGSDSSAWNAKHEQSRAGSGFAVPTASYPEGETPSKLKHASVSDQQLIDDVCTPPIFRGGFDEQTAMEVEVSSSSEQRGRPFGKRGKSATATLASRKESSATATVSGTARNNTGVRRKNAKSDRVVGQLEEDVAGDVQFDGTEMDCSSSSSSRPIASMRRSAGSGSGIIATGCGLGFKGKGQTRIAKERADIPTVQTKTSVAREVCCGEQLRDEDDGACHSKKKPTDFVLWHGLSSKPCGSLDSVLNDEPKTSSSARDKPEFPKEFERFLMATRDYGIHSSSQEISVPAGLDLPLRNLFIKQEKERLKLKHEQNMRWERLLLTIEAEVIREYVDEEKRVDAFRPLISSCTVLCHQNFCSRSHDSQADARPDSNIKSRLKALKEKFIALEADLHFQLQNEISVLHACQVQEWERLLSSCERVNPIHTSPQFCVTKVANLRCLVSAFFNKLNLCQ